MALRGACIAGAVSLMAWCGHGHAEPVQIAAAGGWLAYGNQADGVNTCSVTHRDYLGSLSIEAISYMPQMITLRISRPEWTWGQMHNMVVRMDFPGGITQRVTATAFSDSLLYRFEGPYLASWMHEFTLRSEVTISVEGSDAPPLTLDLTGTTPTITAMGECTKQSGFTQLPLPFTPAAIPDVPLLQSPTAPASSAIPSQNEKVSVGDARGGDAEVLSKTGVGTAHASITVLMDWNRQVRICAADYQSSDPRYTECLSYSMAHFTGPTTMTAAANCLTGEMSGFGQTKSRFYAGQETVDGAPPGSDTAAADLFPVFHYEGFTVGKENSAGTFEDGESFRKMCPTSFTRAPAEVLPLLDLEIDCQAELPDAERIATESGASHILNISIIDAWNVKSEPSTWASQECSADVEFNTSTKTHLLYREIPQHGKYFIQTQIVPADGLRN